MAADGNPDNISIGPGRLYVAVLGTAEPTSATSTPNVAWRAIGYTEEGSTITFDTSFEDIEVAEELEPVDVVNNKTVTMVAFSMAEVTKANMALALSGIANSTSTGSLSPVTPGAELAFMLMWDALDDYTDPDNRRWLFRKVKSKGSIEVALQKSPNKALIPVEFQCLKPAGAGSWEAWPNADGLVF
jgi:hypothetical protein